MCVWYGQCVGDLCGDSCRVMICQSLPEPKKSVGALELSECITLPRGLWSNKEPFFEELPPLVFILSSLFS